MGRGIGRLGRQAVLAVLGGWLALAGGWAAAQAAFTQHGTWWNPAEPGTGFFFEAQGTQAIATFFVYDDDGKPVWYSAPGSFSAVEGGHRFQGGLLQFTDGPVVNDADSVKPPVAQAAGNVTITFTGTRAQVQLPLRSFAAEKYATRPAALRNGTPGVIPETGVYWDPKGSGRGFTIEADGDTVTMGIYAFDRSGYPTWRLAVYPLEAAPVTVRPTVFTGGQTLDGGYKAPAGAPAPTAEDDIRVAFEAPCFAAVSLNGTMSLERFGLGGNACRNAAARAPAARKMLPPDLPADTLLTPAQVRKAAARVLWFTDTLGLHDQILRRSFVYGKDISPGTWWTAKCDAGAIHTVRQDPDNDKLISPGDLVWLEHEGCQGRAGTADGPVVIEDGFTRAAFSHVNATTARARLTYFRFHHDHAVHGDTWFHGDVEVDGWLGYAYSSYWFHGYVAEGTTSAPRLAVRSGTARRLGEELFLEFRYEDLDMRLGLDAATRLQAMVRLQDPTRPLLMGQDYRIADVAQQGVVVIDLQPGQVDGQQIHLRVNGPDRFEIQYRRGNVVISSQTGSTMELVDHGRL